MARVKMFFLLTVEEFRRNLRYHRRYLFSTLTSFVSNLLVMGGIVLVSTPSISCGQDVKDALVLSNAGRLMGFLYFLLGMSSLGLPGTVVSRSRQLGTIDHIALSPLGLSGVVMAGFLPEYLDTLVYASASLGLLALVLKLPLAWNTAVLLINTLVAALGMLGLGFMFGGLTIRFKQLGLLQNLLFALMLLLGILPTGYEMTGTFSSLARYFPFTQGLFRTRNALVPDLAGGVDVPFWLFASCSLALLFVGTSVFRKFEKDALKDGTLTSY